MLYRISICSKPCKENGYKDTWFFPIAIFEDETDDEGFYTAFTMFTNLFKYCEKTYGFSGDEWEEIKDDYDIDALNDLLNNKGLCLEEFYDD